ncbi:MAG: SDR family NAD(P)-dependent oxidoreductase [Sphingomonadaceae bacterium]
MQNLIGKRALVTGAASGIGLAVASKLAAMGCATVLFDLDAAHVETIARRLDTDEVPVRAFAGSVAEPSDVERAFALADSALGGLDILINNAGITGNCPAFDLALETWLRVVAVNQTGTFLCAQAAGRRMAGSGGVIINLSSIYGLVGAPNRLAYSSTKGAVVMMTKALAVEWAHLGIRVNCIAPGYVETAGTAELANAGTIDLAALRRRTPQQRLAQPEDIADAIVTMCDDSMAHVTGQVLAVDGGWSAYGYL